MQLRLQRAKPRRLKTMSTYRNRGIYPPKNENGEIHRDSVIAKRQFAKVLLAELRDGQ
jgi:hypothetical protein